MLKRNTNTCNHVYTTTVHIHDTKLLIVTKAINNLTYVAAVAKSSRPEIHLAISFSFFFPQPGLALPTI